MENTNIVYVLLSFLVLAVGMLAFAIASVNRKVAALMATQAELKNALDVTGTDLDAIKTIVDKLVTNGGGTNVVNQAQFDAFVAQAQANRVKADAVAEAIKALDNGEPGPTPEPENTGGPTSPGGTGSGDSFPRVSTSQRNSSFRR